MPHDRRTNSNPKISQIFRTCIHDERIIEAPIEKALTNQLAAITCPSSCFYIPLEVSSRPLLCGSSNCSSN